MDKERIKDFYQESLAPVEKTPEQGVTSQPVGDQSDIGNNASYMGYSAEGSSGSLNGGNGDEEGPVLRPELPTGGGAIVGYGEHFQADGFTGGASLSFGGQSYNTGNGNGPFGMGFGNNRMGEVSRRTSHGIPTYDDDVDQFLFDGMILVPQLDSSGDIVIWTGSFQEVTVGSQSWREAVANENTSGSYQVRVYRCMEENYMKIQYWLWDYDQGDPGENPSSFWQIISPDNSVHIFGVDSESQIYNPEDTSAEGRRIFKWLLNETLDTSGNATVVTYKREDGAGLDLSSAPENNHIQTAQLYLKEVGQGQATPLPAPLSYLSATNRASYEPKWFFLSVYDYGEYDISTDSLNPYTPENDWDVREDSFSTYFGAFEIRNHRLCKRILSFHQFEEFGTYSPALTAASCYNYTASPICTLMESSWTEGYYFDMDNPGYTVQSQVPIEMRYTEFEPDSDDIEYKPLLREYPSGETGPFSSIGGGLDFTPVDLYSEGIDGLLYSDGTGYAYYQTDYDSVKADSTEVEYSKEKSVDAPINMLAGDQFHSFQDITGNGWLDYVVMRGNQMGYYEYYEDDEGESQWSDFTSLPTYATEAENPQSKLINVCGNGRSDVVMVLQDKVRFYQNNGSDGFAKGETAVNNYLPGNIESSEDTLFQFSGIAGDGKSHLMKVTYEGLEYYPNYGYGVFGKPISMTSFPELTKEEFKTSRVFFVDTDGTGTADMLIFNKTGANLYLNQSGNSFGDAIPIPLPDGVQYDDNDQILFSNLYGTGLSIMIYSKTHPAGSDTPSQQWAYDFCNGMKPYLMQEHINNIGANSVQTYKSSVHYYLEDKANDKVWYTRAPFPSWTLEKLTLDDAISGSTITQSYRYRHSYYDGTEREFRGFGYVEHEDIDTFDSSFNSYDSPPSILKSWFHTGNPDQQEITEKYQNEYFGEDDKAQYLQSMYLLPVSTERSDEVWRQASILMKGTLLHSEIYGEDGGADAAYPYQVQNSNGQVEILQAIEGNPYGVFQRLEREALSYLYERDPQDPKTSYSAALSFIYGETDQQCSILYGRRSDAQTYTVQSNSDAVDAQNTIRCYSGFARFYTALDGSDIGQTSDQFYQLLIPYESQAFVITNLADELGPLEDGAIYSYEALQANLRATDPQSTIPFASGITWLRNAWEKSYYWYVTGGDDASGSTSFDQVNSIGLERPGNRGLLLEHYAESAVLEQEALLGILNDFFTEAELDEQMSEIGKYISNDNDEYWWVSSGNYLYNTSDVFYHPKTYTNPFSQVTTFEYDPYNLMMVKGTDPLGNVTQVKQKDDDSYWIDYQHMHPLAVLDPNQNSAEVLLDALGRVVATSNYGGEMEPDSNGDVSYNANVGFDSLYDGSYTNIDNENDTTADIIAAPFTYLQNARSYFFYDEFSWMGQVSDEDYDGASLQSNKGKLAKWRKQLYQNGLVTLEGGLFKKFRTIIEASSSVSEFGSALAEVKPRLKAVFQELGDDRSVIFNMYKQVENQQPVHVLTMGACDYPDRTHAILTSQDYTDNIPEIDSSKLTNWLQALVDDGLILQNRIYEITFRNLTEPTSSWEEFNTNLSPHSASYIAFNDFSEDIQKQVYELVYEGLTERVMQVIAYNDGFGRSVQSKIKAENRKDTYLYEDGTLKPNDTGLYQKNLWLTQGLDVYNNKAQLVRQYDPFFVNTEDFIDNSDLSGIGTSPTNYYDALGRTFRVVTRKGFLEYHSWTAWGQTTWDANDLFMISPYFIANEANIYSEASSAPDASSFYAQYYDEQMTDADRKAYQKVTLLGWTPNHSITDNRSLPWTDIGLNTAQITVEGIEEALNYAASDAQLLFEYLVAQAYLTQFDSYKTVVTEDGDGNVTDVEQVDIYWGDLTIEFPLRDIIHNLTEPSGGQTYSFELLYQAEYAKIISILFDYKLSGEALEEDALYQAFVTAYGYSPFDSEQCVALWRELSENEILDSDNKVSDLITIPTLELGDFQPDNNKIVNFLFRQFASGITYETQSTFDDLNRPLTLADPRLSESGYVNLTYSYAGSMGNVIEQDSCDGGSKWGLVNVLGRPMWTMDSRNIKTTISYDALTRPLATTVYLVEDDTGWGPATVMTVQYGDTVTFDDSDKSIEQFNYRLRPVQSFTQGGWASISDGYNILGTPLGGMSKFAKPYKPILNGSSVAAPLVEAPELTGDPTEILEDDQLKSTVYNGRVKYDANNEIITLVDPANNDHTRVTHQSGGLRQFEVNKINYIQNVQYNAKKQHISTDFYNDDNEHLLTTHYAYDAMNYRLNQIYTEAISDDVDALERTSEYVPITEETDNTRQNLLYTLDPVGNVSETTGYYQAPQEGEEDLIKFPTGGEYTYDALYRLVQATGYEQSDEDSTTDDSTTESS